MQKRTIEEGRETRRIEVYGQKLKIFGPLTSLEEGIVSRQLINEQRDPQHFP